MESLPGTLSSYADLGNKMAIATNKAGLGYVALLDGDAILTLFRKQDTHFLPPIAINAKGSVFVLQQFPDQPQVVLGVIAPPDYQLTAVGHLSMPAAPLVMTNTSVTGLFAFGLQDGSVMLVSPDAGQTAMFQAAYSPIGGLAFTGDGRYLAVASSEGIKVYAVMP